MQLNCDLGELEYPLLEEHADISSDAMINRVENLVMPYIHQANIACGYHAGDQNTMRHTLQLAKQHNVLVGAHPSYPDRENFGRLSMVFERPELIELIHQQIQCLALWAGKVGVPIRYVKPHGALYNDMMRDEFIRAIVIEAVVRFPMPLALVLQATPQVERHRAEAAAQGLDVVFEAFADRCYTDDGLLLPRNKIGAVHDETKTLAQVRELCEQASVTTISGRRLPLTADTLCVHGDNLQAVQVITKIRALLNSIQND